MDIVLCLLKNDVRKLIKENRREDLIRIEQPMEIEIEMFYHSWIPTRGYS